MKTVVIDVAEIADYIAPYLVQNLVRELDDLYILYYLRIT